MLRTLTLSLFLTGCESQNAVAETTGTDPAPALDDGQAEAIFAAGCFWCIEKPFDVIDGVISTTSGYTGGAELNPTYQAVSQHRTSHYEAIRVVYNPQQVSYETLLTVFWHNIDPTQSNGQFCDRGTMYRSAIFTDNPAEIELAKTSSAQVTSQLGQPVVTALLPASTFWVAEEYHQDFYKKNPSHYQRYRQGCGRDARLNELWGDSAGH